MRPSLSSAMRLATRSRSLVMCVLKTIVRRPSSIDLQQRAEELAAGRGVEAGDRFVEDQQLGLVAEGEHDAEGLELADREGADAVFQRQAPAAAEVVDERLVPSGVERGRVGDYLADAHPGVADDLLRDVAEAGFHVGGEVPGVVAEDGDAGRRWGGTGRGRT